MKDAVLGKKYTLSVTVVGEKKMRELNRQFRNIDKPTDILSFPLEKDSGEIFLNIKYTKLEAKKFERSYENFLAFLFIHGLVHLKGHDHGSTMEALEKRYRSKFGI
jgi:probable rRNA maturation factor